MITNTFRKLADEKKKRIYEAAKKEFSRTHIQKALISNIIRDAGIPRGSFYQYFETIDDLFLALLEHMFGEICNNMSRCLEETNYDFFDAVKLRFKNVLLYFTREENKQFRINIYYSILTKLNDDYFFNDLMQMENKLKREFLPEKYFSYKNIDEALGLISMINYSQLNKCALTDQSPKVIYKEYSEYIDYIRKTLEQTNKEG